MRATGRTDVKVRVWGSIEYDLNFSGVSDEISEKECYEEFTCYAVKISANSDLEEPE
jgi:hypothetical protein